ncbi:prenylated flavin chaperone LpdD [Alkalibacter mobilis]|uniref:prenylated flavin chaperone LpdD n=1 Tax=Alkalibacter mobilis TaxID=2787712 RepID=UPI00189FB80D|nr:hypothetical protein [Alkalibacter mobilis]MBF7097769.1 hypothetical protein [Alkalibacter mobilis]
MEKSISLTSGNGSLAITYEIVFIGSDIQVIISGGEVHIGSVSIGENGHVTTWTSSGHKDDALSEPLARAISREFCCVCNVSTGFHLDNQSNREISEVLNNNRYGMDIGGNIKLEIVFIGAIGYDVSGQIGGIIGMAIGIVIGFRILKKLK